MKGSNNALIVLLLEVHSSLSLGNNASESNTMRV